MRVRTAATVFTTRVRTATTSDRIWKTVILHSLALGREGSRTPVACESHRAVPGRRAAMSSHPVHAETGRF